MMMVGLNSVGNFPGAIRKKMAVGEGVMGWVPMVGKQGLPGNVKEATAAATVAANGGL